MIAYAEDFRIPKMECMEVLENLASSRRARFDSQRNSTSKRREPYNARSLSTTKLIFM